MRTAKRTLRNELIDACRESRSRQKHEVNFSDLAPHEEKQLYTVDRYFVNSMRTRTLFCRRFEDYGEAACRNNALPAGRKAASRFTVLLFSMTDTEIAELIESTHKRSTV